jgi:hypothetical protein
LSDVFVASAASQPAGTACRSVVTSAPVLPQLQANHISPPSEATHCAASPVAIHPTGQENGYESHAKPSTLSAGETWLEVSSIDWFKPGALVAVGRMQQLLQQQQ